MSIQVPDPVAFFPLNGTYGIREIRDRVSAVSSEVQLAPGPDGHDSGSYEFIGTSNSYIEFSNSDGGVLDVRYSITLLCWVYYDNQYGPLFIYHLNTRWGVSFQARYEVYMFPIWGRNGLFLNRIDSNTSVVRGWKFVGASYNYSSGEAKLWIDGVLDGTVNVAAETELGTQYKVRMGGTPHESHYFKGRITQMRVYDVALTQEQVQEIKGKGMTDRYEHRKQK